MAVASHLLRRTVGAQAGLSRGYLRAPAGTWLSPFCPGELKDCVSQCSRERVT